MGKAKDIDESDGYDEGAEDEFMVALRQFFTAYKDDIGSLIRAFGRILSRGRA